MDEYEFEEIINNILRASKEFEKALKYFTGDYQFNILVSPKNSLTNWKLEIEKGAMILHKDADILIQNRRANARRRVKSNT